MVRGIFPRSCFPNLGASGTLGRWLPEKTEDTQFNQNSRSTTNNLLVHVSRIKWIIQQRILSCLLEIPIELGILYFLSPFFKKKI